MLTKLSKNKVVARAFFVFAVWVYGVSIAQSESLSQADMMMFQYADKDSEVSKVLSKSTATTSESLAQDAQIDTWKVEFNSQVMTLQKGDMLQVPLPNGDVFSAEIGVRSVMANGDIQLRAPMAGSGGIVLTVNENIMFASIISVADDINMTIGLNDLHEQVLVDQDTLPVGAIDLLDDMVMPGELILNDGVDNIPSAQALTSEISNIDVLFVYSPEFAQTFTDPEARINQLVGHSNLSYDNTGVLINMRAVGIVELDINNTAPTSTLLQDAQRGQNGFESVSSLRNQFGADLVAVLTSQSGFSSSGVAFIGSFSGGFDSSIFGFSSTRLSPNCCDLVFTHEIGHNLGSGHERTSVNPTQGQPCTGGATGFSCGHGSLENNWGTLMTSSSNLNRNRVAVQFSNLINSCQGEPCGVAQGLSGAADNQSSFNMTRFNVSAFREEVIVNDQDDVEFYVLPLPNGNAVTYPF